MSYFSHTSSLTKFIIVIEFVLVSYLLYSLTKNVYQTYQIDKYIETFELENQAIEDENRQKNEDYLYFTSPEYIDKIAKQDFLKVRPGEQVIILSPDILSANGGGDSEGEDFARFAGLSKPAQWWQFFFGE